MTHAHSMGGPPWPDARALKAALGSIVGAWQQDPHRGGPHHGPHGHPHEEGGHERRFRGHRGPGPFPWDFARGPFGPGFGFGGGRSPFGRGGRKAKRGDVRAAILALLAEEPRNGYQVIQEIAERSQGGWKPSPGAVYPALQQLTDEGLVRAEETDGRKTFALTEAGLAYVAEHPEEVRAPWEDMTPNVDDSVYELFDLSRQAAAALFQIAQTGSDGQVGQAKQILAETRRKLYQILADGDTSEE
ncbi:PadR family transcriptional regulator [Sphaerisporangium corydalis]|uniref:PadR family transcriptional regulator n=1 Tax=Sphaerisporangium corydalis TaxID=1441875 RepID=A0ABV9EF25_9ACTN|nr:PadR family transcriptional regulator [Sphaerisporangium corydalis]